MEKLLLALKKPSSGKTNSYRLVGTDGKKAIQVQVANLDNKRYELNMYKEEVDLEERTEFDTMKAYASGISRILGSQGIAVPINELIDPADVDGRCIIKRCSTGCEEYYNATQKSC